MRRALPLVLAGSLIAPACDRATAVSQSSDKTTNDAKTAKNNFLWERRRQCAARAGEIMRGPEWAKPVAEVGVLGSSYHYNEAADRCYVRVAMITRGARAAGIPLTFYSVFDAFDNGTSLSCSDQVDANANYCSVEQNGADPVFDCNRCRSLAKELMSK